jgi:arylsulfatase A-like enzyme
VREDLALYYYEITRFDRYVGLIMDELAAQGVADNTLIIVMSDNGQPFVRAKTTLYDSGIKTPFLLRWPAGIKAHTISQSVVSAVDIAPTLLELARSFAPILKDPTASIRRYAYAEKHWHDYDDEVRAVTTGRFKYIRNYNPERPGTPSSDGVRSPAYQVALALRGTGRLTPAQTNIFLVPRPTEELYDCDADPFETINLAGNPEYAATLDELRRALTVWQKETGDWIPVKRAPDEFDRETGLATPTRIRPRPTKAEMIERGLIDQR